MPKTLHTPAPDEIELNTILFPSVKIAEFTRFDPSSGVIKFRSTLPKGFETLFQTLGWEVPGDKTTMESLEGKLKGGHLLLSPKLNKETLKVKSTDGKVDTEADVDIEFGEIKDFQCLRLEIEGKKKKGFRRELRFKATFAAKATDSCANLEAYMERTDNAPGSLKVSYLPEPIQTTISHDESQSSLIDTEATEEEQQAAKEATDKKIADIRERIANPPAAGTLASAREMGAGKRKRLNEDAPAAN